MEVYFSSMLQIQCRPGVVGMWDCFTKSSRTHTNRTTAPEEGGPGGPTPTVNGFCLDGTQGASAHLPVVKTSHTAVPKFKV